MKKLLFYSLWFVPAICFVLGVMAGFLLAMFIARTIDGADWILLLPIVTGPLGAAGAYHVCCVYIVKNTKVSLKFKNSYKTISLGILGAVILAVMMWSVYAMFQVNALPQDMGG